MKKPFKETKVGKWLSEKAPKVLDVVGDALPEKGLLGIVKNLIDKEPDLTSEQRLEFQIMLHEFEKDLMQFEAEEKKNARQREIDFVKATGHIDWMHTITGMLILISFIMTNYFLLNYDMPDKSEHIIVNLVGILEGAVLMVVSYYFGSSAGSRIKDVKGKGH